MSDIAKWALLIAGALALIALILALPFVDFIDFAELTSAIANVVDIAGDAFRFGRGLVNNFLLPFGRTVVSGLMMYFLCKWVLTLTIKIGAWIYHFIFK